MSQQLEIIHCEQGSLDWHRARLGVLTASVADVLLKKARNGGPSEMRATLMRDLAGQRITGELPEEIKSIYFERGHEVEPDARNFYAMLTDIEPVQIGFMRRNGVGCSPDSLVGEDGLLEIKSRAPKHQIDVLLEGGLPAEHKAQVQFQLWVSARRWCDYLSYCPGLPPLLVRVDRDEPYIASLAVAAAEFLAELDAMIEQIRDYDWTRNYITQKAAA
jgi:hypothetical protein